MGAFLILFMDMSHREETKMENHYEMWEFSFVDKRTKMRCVVYARTEEIALKIIHTWDSPYNMYCWVKRRFRYKKRVYTSIPPYEVEQEQIETIEGYLEYAKAHSDGQ